MFELYYPFTVMICEYKKMQANFLKSAGVPRESLCESIESFPIIVKLV